MGWMLIYYRNRSSTAAVIASLTEVMAGGASRSRRSDAASRTGLPNRVVWAHPVTRIAWEVDDWSVWEGTQDGSQQERL
jgi:hypothetical protein